MYKCPYCGAALEEGTLQTVNNDLLGGFRWYPNGHHGLAGERLPQVEQAFPHRSIMGGYLCRSLVLRF